MANKITTSVTSGTIPTQGWTWTNGSIPMNTSTTSFNGLLSSYSGQTTYCAYCIKEDKYVQAAALVEGTSVCADHVKQLIHVIDEELI